jgi:cyanophycinase
MVHFPSSRRRLTRLGLRPNLEALEGRFCLNAATSAMHLSGGAHSAIKPMAKSTADYSYVRTGNANNAQPMKGSGGVALEGGGTDVSQAFQWMISQMGGKGDFLVLTAVKNTGYDSYISKLGNTNSVATLEIPSRAAANDPAVISYIQNADAVFIAGGAQNDYINFWQGTGVQTALGNDIERGVPVGGTSAGADVIGQFIYSAEGNSVTSAEALANPTNSDMTFAHDFVSSSEPPPGSPPGTPPVLGYLNNTLVDTHFVTEDRLGRMTAFLASVQNNGWSSAPMGIGINEETALLITKDGIGTVVGNAKATSPPQVDFFDTSNVTNLVVQPNQPLTYYPIQEAMVLPGGTFDLSDWAASWQVTNAYTTHATITVTNGVLSSS